MGHTMNHYRIGSIIIMDLFGDTIFNELKNINCPKVNELLKTQTMTSIIYDITRDDLVTTNARQL